MMGMDTNDKKIIEENFIKWNIPRPQQDYMVVIHCSTYNHGKYIEDALKGFVMQQTKFPFCAIVIDDGSTDNATEIIRRYAELYPENIKPILLGENHMQHGKSRDPYFKEWWSVAKYIAMCEGDDYWTDPLKLQKQVDFLEENGDYVLSFHDARIIDEEGNLITESKIKLNLTEKMYRDWSDFDLMCGYTPFTPTVVYRREVRAKVGREMYKAKGLINGDTIVASLIGKYGKGKFHNDIQNSVCRVQRGGIWQMKSDLYKSINQYKTYTFLQRIHKNRIVKRKMRTLRLSLCSKIVLLSDADKSFFVNVRYYLRMLFLAFVCCDIKIVHNTNKGIIYNIFKK